MWFFGRHASGHWYSFVKGIELLREITDPTKLPIPWFLLDGNQGNLLRGIDNFLGVALKAVRHPF